MKIIKVLAIFKTTNPGDRKLIIEFQGPKVCRIGGVLKLFFDRVCGTRSQTPTISKDFSSLKKRLI